MSRAAAIGEEVRIAGYALAGVELLAAEDAGEARSAWERLSQDVACLIVTARARDALGARLAERPRLVVAVMPE
ncbi:MAG: hypothetical protein ACLGI5_03850 [Thermoleophilia bacterium]